MDGLNSKIVDNLTAQQGKSVLIMAQGCLKAGFIEFVVLEKIYGGHFQLLYTHQLL